MKITNVDYGRVIFALIGFSASFLFLMQSFKRKRAQQITTDKLRLVSEALEVAEERVVRFQERHDHILAQICSHYLINQELQDALAGARAAMNEALEFAVGLRKMQMKLLNSL